MGMRINHLISVHIMVCEQVNDFSVSNGNKLYATDKSEVLTEQAMNSEFQKKYGNPDDV